jgi:hypothetical protein
VTKVRSQSSSTIRDVLFSGLGLGHDVRGMAKVGRAGPGASLLIVTVYEPTPPGLRQPDHYSRLHGPPGDPDVYLAGSQQSGADGGLAGCTTATIPDPVSVAARLAQYLADRPAFLLVVGGERHRVHWPSSVLRELLRSPRPILVAEFRPQP